MTRIGFLSSLNLIAFVVWCVSAFVGSALLMAVMFPVPAEHAAPAHPPVQVTTGRYGEAIAAWDPQEKTLTVGAHFPGDALLCIEDECRRPQDWRSR